MTAPSRCTSCHAVGRHLSTCATTRWRGRRIPDVTAGRPYVLKRSGRWFVLTREEGCAAIATGSGNAHDVARFWAVAWHGMTVAEVGR